MKENKSLTTIEIEKIIKIAKEKSKACQSTLYIHDIENIIGHNKHEIKKPNKLSELRSLLLDIDNKLNVENSDLVIISGNYNLLQFINKLYYKKTPCEEILIPAKGRDAADIKLIETIYLLHKAGIIDMFKNVVIISGDNRFYTPIKELIEGGFDVKTYSKSPETTANNIRNINNHKYVNNLNKQKITRSKQKKRNFSISREDKFLYNYKKVAV